MPHTIADEIKSRMSRRGRQKRDRIMRRKQPTTGLARATDVSKNTRGAQFVSKDRPTVATAGVSGKGLSSGGMGALKRSPVATAVTSAPTGASRSEVAKAAIESMKGRMRGRVRR